MRIYRGHALTKRHEPRELKHLLREHGAPPCTYHLLGAMHGTWPKAKGVGKDDQMHLIVLPGEPDNAWPRSWMEHADRVIVVDASGKDIAMLKARDEQAFDHRPKQEAA